MRKIGIVFYILSSILCTFLYLFTNAIEFLIIGMTGLVLGYNEIILRKLQ